jgi:hypothetical protein
MKRFWLLILHGCIDGVVFGGGIMTFNQLYQGDIVSGLVWLAVTVGLFVLGCYGKSMLTQEPQQVRDAVQTTLASMPSPYALRAVELQRYPDDMWALHDLRTHTDMPIEEGDVLLLAMPLLPKDAEEEI